MVLIQPNPGHALSTQVIPESPNQLVRPESSKPRVGISMSLNKVQRTDAIESIETQLHKIRSNIDSLEETFSAPIPESVVAAGDDTSFIKRFKGKSKSDIKFITLFKRWFVRESYSVRLVIDSVSRIQVKTIEFYTLLNFLVPSIVYFQLLPTR